jgi:hypothetical protein
MQCGTWCRGSTSGNNHQGSHPAAIQLIDTWRPGAGWRCMLTVEAATFKGAGFLVGGHGASQSSQLDACRHQRNMCAVTDADADRRHTQKRAALLQRVWSLLLVCRCTHAWLGRSELTPARTMAENADRWQFLATRRVSPGLHVARTAAWMPTVLPFTRNQVWSAPYAAAASSWASFITPAGADR